MERGGNEGKVIETKGKKSISRCTENLVRVDVRKRRGVMRTDKCS